MIGRELKQYRVVEAIGAGGMGVVYRAHDTRLSRDVALKVLPQGSLADENARKRFRKEAFALSRLSHPHIASLFDFDTTDDGTDFLVMELVPGASLDTRLKRGPLPEKEVVRLGAQVARALVAAHDQGVLHRDLKPQNLKTTADGLVKVLDFGLARVGPVLGDDATTDTASGSVAGTPPYMSPEQLLGKEVDARTDVYAAGVVLYEMATGRRPFGSASGPQLVAKILNEPMPLPREVNPALSPVLEQVILKATDKDRELRHQTAKELLVDLERLATGLAPSSPAGGSSAGEARDGRPTKGRTAGGLRKWLGRWAWLIATAPIALAATILWSLRPATPRVVSFHTLAQRVGAFQGLATDGVSAFFAESRITTDGLYSVPLSGGDPVEISLPWSGNVWVRVFDAIPRPPSLLIGKRGPADEAWELWRLPLGGGSPSRLAALPGVHSARLSRRGDRVAYVSPVASPKGNALFVAGVDGSGPRLLVGPHDFLALQVWKPGDEALRVLSTEDKARFLDVSTEGRVVWPEPPGEGWGAIVPRGNWSAAPTPDWTPDGRFFVWADEGTLQARAERRPFWARRVSAAARLAAPSHVTAMRFTPDGHRIVAQVQRPGSEVVRYEPRTGDVAPLLGGARAGVAEFSPDGAWVAWVSNDGGRARLWRSRPDGSSSLQLTEPKRFDVSEIGPVRWSPDGHWIAFSAFGDPPESVVNPQVFVVHAETGAIERPGVEERLLFQADPCWTPDGRRLIYSVLPGATAGDSDLYVRSVDLATRQPTRMPGSEGLWSTKCALDGRILAFDEFARRAHARQGRAANRAFFKLWRPGVRQWSAFSIDLRTWEDLNYPTWTPDGRFVYANATADDPPRRALIRFAVETRRIEVIARVDGLRADFWMNLAPDGVPMVHRDVSVHEVVVMDWEAR